MGVSSITPAFPLIADQFAISDSQTGWLITVFYIPGIALTPFVGRFADRFGRRPILIPSLFIFGLAGAACALAPSFEYLLLFRFLQGVGGSAIGTLNLTLIGDLFSGESRTKAMGYNASVLSVGTAIYPAIGGGLAVFGWNYPFILPLLAIPVGLLVLYQLEMPTDFSLKQSSSILSVVKRIIQRPVTLGLFFLNFTIFVVLFGPYLNYFPLFLSDRFGFSSLYIGLFMSGVSMIGALTAASVGRLTEWFGHRILVTVGFGMYTAAFALLPACSSIWTVTGVSCAYGAAQGINIPSLQTLVSNAAPESVRGTYMALNSTVYRLGQTSGPVGAAVLYRYAGVDAVFIGASIFTGILAVLLTVSK
jgi:MFS family permease